MPTHQHQPHRRSAGNCPRGETRTRRRPTPDWRAARSPGREFLRAIITADSDLVPDDRLDHRLAVVQAFRRCGIFPDSCLSLSPDNLLWTPATQDQTDPAYLPINDIKSEGLELVPQYRRSEIVAALAGPADAGSHPDGTGTTSLDHIPGGCPDHRRRPGPVPRGDLAPAPVDMRLHVRAVLRGQADLAAWTREPVGPGSTAAGKRPEVSAGRAYWRPQLLARGGERGRGTGPRDSVRWRGLDRWRRRGAPRRPSTTC